MLLIFISDEVQSSESELSNSDDLHDSDGTPMTSNTEIHIVKEAEALPSGTHISVTQKTNKITVMVCSIYIRSFPNFVQMEAPNR